MKTIIALSGKMGSGKTAASDFIHRKYGAKQMRFSQILMDILARLHQPVERSTLQKMGHALRTSVGETVVVDAFRADLEAEDAEIIVVDGVRYLNEVELVRSFPGSILLYLDAPQKIRYERCVKRGEKGEASISLAEFTESENKETERHLDEIMKLADFVIENEGSIAQLEQRVDEILKDATACD